MFKQTLKIFFLLVCLHSIQLHAQITITPTTGCVPLVGVTYSGPAGATNILWNFGDGVTSNLSNPNHNYTAAGSFTITYNATVSGNPYTATAVVNVFPPPVANFSFIQPASGCAPKTVTFTNLSTAGGGATLNPSSWTFGNGGGSVTASSTFTYAYTNQGSFSVTLLAQDQNGCSSNITLGTINVSNPPTVVISATPMPLNSCVAPFSPSFNGNGCVSNSPTGGALTYSWNFGNTQTSTQQNPGTITYNTIGNYNVSLTVTDNNNCSATANVPVTVSQPSVNATVPGTVCLGSKLFITDQSNVPFTFWNMGDGATYNVPTSTSSQSVHIYNTPGVYTINIIAYSGTCQATVTKTVLVEQVVANFTHTPPSFTCSPTFTASYINQSSSNAVSYTWSATNYNGQTTSTSTLTNPTFTLVQGSLNPYTIYNTFEISVTLVAQSAFGCISTFTSHVYDSIRRPTAWFNKDKKEGCVPLTVKYRDSSFTSATYPITSYTWNNGANPAQTITGVVPPPIVNPAFTYTAAGTFTPYLIVQTATGCIDTSFIDTVTVVNPPNVNITFSPNIACWNDTVKVNLSTSPQTTPAVQHWHVDSDDGFFSGCVSDPNPQWNFTHVGVHTFTVSGYLHSCKSANTATSSITVKGPIAQGRFETNCNAGTRKNVTFYSYIQDAQNATLNFGDNSSAAIACTPGSNTSHNIVHTYSASGNYTAVLTATNSITGCAPYTYTMLVKVRDAVASFTMPAVACASVAQTFDATSSLDVDVSCHRGYVWYIDNFPPNDTTSAIYSQGFTTPGTHTVMLMVKDENSCGDTTRKTFRVSQASPAFSLSANPICLSNGTVNLINQTSQSPDPITAYQWNFGDGSPTSNSSAAVITHIYTSAIPPGQTYTITLTATNSQGCTDAITHTITVNNPVASLNPVPFLPCTGTPVIFTAPTGLQSYTFSFGANTQTLTTTSNTVSYTYTSAVNYNASVTVQDAGGCINSSGTAVSVQSISAASFVFSGAGATSTNNVCAGSPVAFYNTTNSSFPLNYNWNLNNGSNIINSGTVINTYTATGSVPISLTVSTIPNGCVATITKTLTIYGVKANLNLDKITVCLGNTINFNVKDSTTLFSWIWDFGDGTTSPEYTASASPPTMVPHQYNFYPSGGNTSVSLTYYSSGKTCSNTAIQPIQVVKIPADFDRNNELVKLDSVHCINIPDVFSNTTPGSSGFTFNWSFGDGGTSTTQNPTYTYPTAGVYQVSLTVNDPVNNCKGFSVKNMTINALPSVSILGPDSVCQGSTFTLTGTGSGVSYTWSPASAVSSSNTASTTSTGSVSPMSYSLAVTDANGCSNTTTANIYIQAPPDTYNWDTTVIVGQIIPLSGYAGINFNYTWTPTTDLNCTSCYSPISSSTVDITYSLTVEDGLGCFRITNTFSIHVDPRATADVPTAFTPNGDGTNDVIYVDGWGIKKLNYFRIYNRWGQLLFETNDIKVGWDGTFNGVPQNMETYVYQVSVDTFIEKEALLKTGSFKLIR